jgi:hypothetical protein
MYVATRLYAEQCDLSSGTKLICGFRREHVLYILHVELVYQPHPSLVGTIELDLITFQPTKALKDDTVRE